MFYFVDESGNTGANLFDPNQPNLHYGVIGCRKNLDIVARPLVERLRAEVKRVQMEAAENTARALQRQLTELTGSAAEIEALAKFIEEEDKKSVDRVSTRT